MGKLLNLGILGGILYLIFKKKKSNTPMGEVNIPQKDIIIRNRPDKKVDLVCGEQAITITPFSQPVSLTPSADEYVKNISPTKAQTPLDTKSLIDMEAPIVTYDKPRTTEVVTVLKVIVLYGNIAIRNEVKPPYGDISVPSKEYIKETVEQMLKQTGKINVIIMPMSEDIETGYVIKYLVNEMWKLKDDNQSYIVQWEIVPAEQPVIVQDTRKIGGFVEKDTKSSAAQRIIPKAIAAIEEEHGDLQFVDVIKYEEQIADGTDYRVTLFFKNLRAQQVHWQVVIHEGSYGELSLTSKELVTAVTGDVITARAEDIVKIGRR